MAGRDEESVESLLKLTTFGRFILSRSFCVDVSRDSMMFASADRALGEPASSFDPRRSLEPASHLLVGLGLICGFTLSATESSGDSLGDGRFGGGGLGSGE